MKLSATSIKHLIDLVKTSDLESTKCRVFRIKKIWYWQGLDVQLNDIGVSCSNEKN